MFAMVGEATLVVAFALGLLIICIVGRLIKLPIQLFMKFVSNSVVGALMLAIVNAFGFGVKITVLKALLAGMFGVPGVLLIVIWDKFLAG